MELNKITEKIIGCAIGVNKILGPGFLDSVYEEGRGGVLHRQTKSS
jgi:hypothetical protein